LTSCLPALWYVLCDEKLFYCDYNEAILCIDLFLPSLLSSTPHHSSPHEGRKRLPLSPEERYRALDWAGDANAKRRRVLRTRMPLRRAPAALARPACALRQRTLRRRARRLHCSPACLPRLRLPACLLAIFAFTTLGRALGMKDGTSLRHTFFRCTSGPTTYRLPPATTTVPALARVALLLCALRAVVTVATAIYCPCRLPVLHTTLSFCKVVWCGTAGRAASPSCVHGMRSTCHSPPLPAPCYSRCGRAFIRHCGSQVPAGENGDGAWRYYVRQTHLEARRGEKGRRIVNDVAPQENA